MIKKLSLFLGGLLVVFSSFGQTISEYNYNVAGGVTESYDTPGAIVYPTGYSNSSVKTPVIFVHGITGTLSGSYSANIDQVKNYNLKAAFVQLNPLGSTTENGLLLKRMIDRIRGHFHAETVSIVAHSKGGLDTERALYYRNPSNWNIPSFGYEKVDAVYTFSSPVEGARVADLGATLSYFSGLVWATMWYTNGQSLTSGSVQSFHNWATSWTINSNGTFKNYYHPNGASYSRTNMSEDNTTRWWAHQSDDPCYDDVWYYCYIGRPFHHSVGAYYDAYWEWDWFDSGWRNWHTSNDGFISEYRAKRDANTNAYPSLTPGAGDANYRTMYDANHSSLWESGENHFSREVAPYLHYGLFGAYAPLATNENTAVQRKESVDVLRSQIMGSNGNVYYGKDFTTTFIVEEDNQPINFIFYGEETITRIVLTDKTTAKNFKIEVEESKEDRLSGAFISVAQTAILPKGVYELQTDQQDFLLVANYAETSTAFAVNFNFDEKVGYNGEVIELGIANKDQALALAEVELTAVLSKISTDGDEAIAIEKVETKNYHFDFTKKAGIYATKFPNLTPGAVYALRIEAKSTSGDVLLSRNIVTTFFVKKEIPNRIVSAITESIPQKEVGERNNIQLYPNPSSDLLRIQCEVGVIQRVVVLDHKGNVRCVLQLSPSSTVAISTKDIGLEKGLYFLQITTTEQTFVEKFVRQ